MLSNSSSLTPAKGLFQKIKTIFFAYMKKHSFITVILMASIPNPLFDLAGLTCGHLLIPFITFFTATIIGKAFIKVHLQLFLIIFGFSDKSIKLLLRKISEFGFSEWSLKLANIIEKQKLVLTGEQEKESDFNLISFVWNCFLGLMILYFIGSVIDSVAKEYYLDQKKKEKKE